MKIFLIFATIFTVVMGVSLFHLKHKVVELESERAGLLCDIRDVKEECQILHAEWAVFTDPERISRLAKKHLKMDAAVGDQVVWDKDLSQPVEGEQT